jgi:hypothetical protein
MLGIRKGEIVEDLFFTALEELQREGKIVKFEKSLPFSKDDIEGRDFTVVLPRKRGTVFFQIKSRPFTKDEIARYRKKGIFCLTIQPAEKIQKIKKQILIALERAPKHRRD